MATEMNIDEFWTMLEGISVDCSGEDWGFEDEALCREKLPRLWARFGQ